MFKLWYGGDRKTINHLLKMGAGVQHLNENVIEVTGIEANKLRSVKRVFVLNAPRTSFEAALVEAATARGYFNHA